MTIHQTVSFCEFHANMITQHGENIIKMIYPLKTTQREREGEREMPQFVSFVNSFKLGQCGIYNSYLSKKKKKGGIILEINIHYRSENENDS